MPFRAFVCSDEPRLLVEESCLLYDVPIDKIGAANLPLGDIFLGELALSQYPAKLLQNMGVDEGKAYGIAFEVNKRVFLRFSVYFRDAATLQEQWKVRKSEPLITVEAAQKRLFEEIEVGLFEDQTEERDESNIQREAILATQRHLPLLKALAEYPRLGEQALTTEKIRIKGQPEPVRPTLSNWIRYYRDELGIGFHDQVTRGKFLFQSENGKQLGNEERERINLVLKSLEEEFPLDIDTDRAVIVFPARTQASPASSAFPRRDPASLLQTRPAKLYQGVPAVAPAPIQTQAPTQTPTQAPAPSTLPVSPVKSFLSGTFGKTKNVANDTLHFSTGHVLSSEKPAPSAPAPQTPPTPMPRPVVPNPSQSINMASINRSPAGFLPRSPYSIRPLRLRDEKTDFETENR